MSKLFAMTETAEFKARAAERRRTWRVTRYTNFEHIKRDEYRAWATMSDAEKFATISEITTAAYALKGIHVRRLPRPHRTPE